MLGPPVRQGYALRVFQLIRDIAYVTPQTKTPSEMLKEIAAWWPGQYSTQRQVAADAAWARPNAKPTPELTTVARRIMAVQLDAPQLGENVIYFEEFRATEPEVAARQRVTALVWDESTASVRSLQYFFKSGPAYDRKAMPAAQVAKMTKDDFVHQAPCDVYFKWEPDHQRYKGGMLPRSCEYEHPGDGLVYAEFDMILWPDALWYRDRSRRVANHTIRGEIDGFIWLRFDKTSS
jgi:CpeT/CpcT family (DUF1001)